MRRMRLRRLGGLWLAVVLGASTCLVTALAVPDPAGAGTVSVAIAPAAAFTDTGVAVTAGDSIRITASGTIDIGNSSVANHGLETPDGAACGGLTGFPLASVPCWSLLARIGTSVFFVGSSSSVSAWANGELFLGPNDDVLGDNTNTDDGGWVAQVTTFSSVTITPGVSPAPVPATTGDGAVVSFTRPTASDDFGDVPVSCNHEPGETFPIGSTFVYCHASSHGQTVHTTLCVVVTGPGLMIAAEVDPDPVATTSPAGAPVTFDTPTATYNFVSIPVSCDHHSGEVFPVGATLVTCSASPGEDGPEVDTTFTVVVFVVPVPQAAPSPPMIGTANPGPGSAIVSFSAPYSEGTTFVRGYAATCVSSNNGATGSATGLDSPITVPNLTVGAIYRCTVTATNTTDTSGPSDPSNPVSPSATDDCTNTTVCHAQVPTPASSTTPLQTVTVTGRPSSAHGSVSLSVELDSLDCPSVPPAIAPVTTLDDTGFSAATSLTVTLTLHLTTATAPEQVCFVSTLPFKSQSSPTVAAPGPALLLNCTQVANVAPCVVSSKQVGNNWNVTFKVPGGDPKFSLVVPKGRQVWLSRFPQGKVGARYSAQLQSSGGKAPIHWSVVSGKLPAGLTLNASTGAITGTPKAKGSFNVTVKATDSESPPKIAQMSVPISVK